MRAFISFALVLALFSLVWRVCVCTRKEGADYHHLFVPMSKFAECGHVAISAKVIAMSMICLPAGGVALFSRISGLGFFWPTSIAISAFATTCSTSECVSSKTILIL